MIKEQKYYQLKTTIATPLRNFHNWIKTNLINTIFNEKAPFFSDLSFRNDI